jgi:hypothetical protein
MSCNTMLRAWEEVRFGHAKSRCRCAIKGRVKSAVGIKLNLDYVYETVPYPRYTFHSSSSGL